MARLKIEGFKELDRMFEQLGKPQQMQIKAVKAAAPVLLKEVRNAVKSSGGHDSLARSFDATDPKENQYGVYSVIKPSGRNRKKNTEYVRIAAFLEYGTTWPKKQEDADKIHHGKQKGLPKKPDAQPWRQKAVNAATEKCRNAMQAAISEEVDKLC